ncbi:hypothetical protein BD626DRAFT_563871 [Schizophyllum amplum]|uniref:Enoyl reductase (ER) domain-containing protein n=1 Tax=Schizophyllum amplum TaxID=97359 RepID=A0A550CZI7_9AGAR|nr:hypothetical protein BD626DRAFT_563871 [Auriculariopsis ampla]
MTLPTSGSQYVFPGFNGFRNMTLRKVPVDPPVRDEVLVKVHAVSLNYRDNFVAAGKYPRPVKAAPIIPCADMAGEVVAVGPEAFVAGASDGRMWKVGDRVCPSATPNFVTGAYRDSEPVPDYGAAIDGVLCEYKIVPAHSLLPIPEHLSYEEASTLCSAPLTAYNALFSGPEPLKAGDYMLTLGTGGVSIVALQLAIAAGVKVIVTSSSDEKLEIAKKLGAHHTVNYRKTPEWHEEVLKITGGRGVDHVVEVGGLGTLGKSLKACCTGAKVHLIGFVAEGQLDAAILFDTITKTLTLRGILIGSIAQWREMMRIVDFAKIKPVVDKVFPYEKAVEAFDHLESHLFMGKVVVQVCE